MELPSEDDLNLKGMTRDELDRAWDLWFDLAQTTNDSDPEYTHGVFVGISSRHAKDEPGRLSSSPNAILGEGTSPG